MAVEIENIYMDLNKLLADICQFLSDKNICGKLSGHSQRQADLLLKRSKTQLQQIAKLSTKIDEPGEYVDMHPQQVNNIALSPVEEIPYYIMPAPNEPYVNLPAQELCTKIKYGNLSWRKKNWLFGFGYTYSKIYAGIHNDWLILYSNEKDSKPLQTFHLEIYKAEAATKAKHLFELICLNKKTKSQFFVAEAPKDMYQWVSYINQVHEGVITDDHFRRSDNSDKCDEIYDVIDEKTGNKKTEMPDDDEDDDGNPYDVIVRNPEPPKVKPGIKLDVPLPPIPVVIRESLQSQVSYYSAGKPGDEVSPCEESDDPSKAPDQNENRQSLYTTDKDSFSGSDVEGDYDVITLNTQKATDPTILISDNIPEPPLKPKTFPKPKNLPTFSTFTRQS